MASAATPRRIPETSDRMPIISGSSIDMLGHGWTDKPLIDYEVKNCADHVLAVLKISMISGESWPLGRGLSCRSSSRRGSSSTPLAAAHRSRRG
jgi:hypothetical protein